MDWWGNRAVVGMGRCIRQSNRWSGGLAVTHNNNGFEATRCEVLASQIGYQHRELHGHTLLLNSLRLF